MLKTNSLKIYSGKNQCFIIFIILSLLFFATTFIIQAATVTWDNGSGDGLWSTALNWSGNVLPSSGDDVVFDATSTNNCTADNVSNNLSSITISAGYSNTVLFKKNAVAGGMNLTVSNIIINAGSIVFEGDTTAVGDGTATNKFGIGYSINTTNIYIAAGGSLNADKQGFTANNGPGKGNYTTENGAGSGYGGRGGKSYFPGGAGPFTVAAGGTTYGSATAPTALGSGGGQYSWGGVKAGGAIKITVNGAITVNGTLSANAGNSGGNAGGGSGGSIWITSGLLKGSGIISANGGSGSGYRGGGGGGRIDISGTTNNFTGSLEVKGRNNARCHPGRAGTILFPQSSGTGLILDNFNLTNNLILGNNIEYTFGTLTINNGATLILDGDPYEVNGGSGGTTNGTGVVIRATNIEIKTGGSISADGMGFGQEDGPGKGSGILSSGGGGGYGGKGRDAGNGALGGGTYGLITAPTALGSGGGHSYSASGGGAIKLIATNLTINGILSANGDNQDTWEAGGGSGGSIWVVADTIAGTNGVISANGGNGATARGGGGGGCILVEYTTNNSTNQFGLETNIFAYGGWGNQYGGSGTIVVKQKTQTYGDFISDNNNYNGVLTEINTNNFTGNPPTLTFDNFKIRNGTKLDIQTNMNIAVNGDFINSNASIFAYSNSTVTLTSTNEATVSGSNDFWNLTSTSVGKRINFEAGSTNNISGMLKFKNVELYSTSPGSYWYLNVSGTQDVSNVFVHDSNAGGGLTIEAYNSYQTSWNNPNWSFIALPGTVVIIQ